MRFLVENGTNVEVMNIFGLTPLGTLSMKSQNDPTECKTQLLLECGTNIEAMDEMGNKILSGASSWVFAANVAFLLDHEAKIGARNVTGTTALHEAACHGQVSTLSVLLDRGADIEARDVYGQTALYMAADADSRDVARELLERGADTTVTSVNGLTPYCGLVCRDPRCQTCSKVSKPLMQVADNNRKVRKREMPRRPNALDV